MPKMLDIFQKISLICQKIIDTGKEKLHFMTLLNQTVPRMEKQQHFKLDGPVGTFRFSVTEFVITGTDRKQQTNLRHSLFNGSTHEKTKNQ